MMKSKRLSTLVGAALVTLSAGLTMLPSFSDAQDTVMVGGAAMSPSKTIVENAANSNDHTTLVAALKAAGLVETLSGDGPFTVFAPTNEAFAKLPPGTVDMLLKPENKAKLTSILTYHVVAGNMTAADIAAKADKSGGKTMLKPVEGDSLTVMKDGDGTWWVIDSHGGKGKITIPNVMQSNGVIHVIDTVMMPK